MDLRARWFFDWRLGQGSSPATRHFLDQLSLSHHWPPALLNQVQRAGFIFAGAVYLRRRLSQLSSRISARLSQWGETLAVGSDQMVDLDFIEARTDQWSASRTRGIDFLERDQSAKCTEVGSFRLSVSDKETCQSYRH